METIKELAILMLGISTGAMGAVIVYMLYILKLYRKEKAAKEQAQSQQPEKQER